jgi:NAD(P)-dependent dehydrogenase (short-subunit alcohol dehydrogenase family)
MDFDQEYFNGKTVVVTGAFSGIGLQLSKDLLASGATVFMADINAETLDSVRKEVNNDNAHLVITDVTKDDQVKELIEQAANFNGHLDIVFNNAGIVMSSPWEDITLEDWHRVIDINLWGVIHGLHYAVPIMRKQGYGHIVNTSSSTGLAGFPYQAPYSSSKAAISTIAESLQYELEDENIHITTIYPGFVATSIFDQYGSMPDEAIPVEEATKIILNAVSHQETKVVFPENMDVWMKLMHYDYLYRDYNLREIAKLRRHNFKTKGKPY